MKLIAVRAGGAVVLGLLSLSCMTSEITRVGTVYSSRGEGCAVAVFPATNPNFPFEVVASSRAKCHRSDGPTACMDQLKADACEVGADAMYAFSESVMGEYTMIRATLARKTREAPAVAPSAAPPVASDGCNPPCSPGYACDANVCEPVCNPACDSGEICTRERICELTPAGI